MLANDREALVCDLAETYHVLEMDSLPVSLLATLAAGLREDSRSRILLSGTSARLDTVLLAAAVDKLSLLVWAQTRDGQRGSNRPPSVLAAITGGETPRSNTAYDTAEEYEAAKQQILRG